jgi:hypothetical protein
MRTCHILLAVLALVTPVFAASNWIGYSPPSSPAVQLVESSRNTVVFDVTVPGLWIVTGDSGTSLIAGTSPDRPVHDPRSIPTISTLIATPAGCQISSSLVSQSLRQLSNTPGSFTNWENENPLSNEYSVQVGDQVTMRGMTMAAVTVPLVHWAEDEWHQVLEARVRINISGGEDVQPAAPYCTEAFHQLWESVILNSREILDPIIPIPGAYLLIAPDNTIPLLEPLVQWKHRSGHPVRVAGLNETGTSTTSIRDYIANAYQTWNPPPEYVILVGDVVGNYSVPTFYIQGTSAMDCTDLPYTLIEGDDYFPEILIGRLSVSSANEISVVVNKILSYEMDPYLSGSNWFERGLVIANNISNPPYFVMSSSRLTKLWVRDMALDYGYSEVDTIFYPGQSSPQLIINSIDSGVSFVNYRGYGHYEGWMGPDFLVPQVNDLNNVHMLPVVTSIVCGGGNFAHSSVCFGEAWLRLGSTLLPRGAVAFVGPSELDTKTWFNNCIDAGIYWGIFQDNLPTLGQALLRGKLEAYIQFPFYHEPGNSSNSVHFYYHVYNILGDPGLRLWTAYPTAMDVNHPEELITGTNNVTVTVTSGGLPATNARVALATIDTLLAIDRTDQTGTASLLMNPVEGDSVLITITGQNRVPYLNSISITQATAYITLESYSIDDDSTSPSQGNGDGIPNPGERLEITATGQNAGLSSVPNVTAVFQGIGVLDSTASFGTIPPGGSSTGSNPFLIEIPLESSDGEVIGYTIIFQSDSNQWSSALNLAVSAPVPVFVSYRALDGGNGLLDPGEQADVVMSFTNQGSTPTGIATITLSSPIQSGLLQLLDSVATITSIDPGDTVEISGDAFTMRASDDILPAEPADVWFLWEDANGWEDSATVTLVLGEVGPGDPTAPDAYGYRAFDNGDTNYINAPVYDWMELHPGYGGPGVNTGIRDSQEGQDQSVIMELPFDFTFYGESYQRITICSNGWVCMGETPMVTMQNFGIPSSMSPPALIAGFWDDLIMPITSFIFTYHDALNHRFIIEYHQMANVVDNSEETFQIILNDPLIYTTPSGDGVIEFQYQAVHDVDDTYCYATVGIQCPEPRIGVQYSYFNSLSPGADSLVEGRAIRFITTGYIPGPYIRVTGYEIDDDNIGASSGNDDGEINNAETIELWTRVHNFGHQTASNLTASLRSTDPYITILDSTCSYGALPPQDSLWSDDPFLFYVHGDIPHDHRIGISTRITDDQGNQWISPSGLYAHSPQPFISSVQFDDDVTGQSQGNNNGELNPGETVELSLTIGNSGGNDAVSVEAILRSSDPLITLVDSIDLIAIIQEGDSTSTGFEFAVTLSESAQDSDVVTLEMYLQDSTGANCALPFTLLAKDFLVLYHHKNLDDPAPAGNANGYADPGETVDLSLVVCNDALGTATGISAVVTTSDTNFALQGGTLTFPDLPGYSQVTSLNTFSVTIHDSCPNPYQGIFHVNITADGGYAVSDSFHLAAGRFLLFTDFDGDHAIWIHGGAGDDWDTTGIDYISFPKSLYAGDEITLQYSNNSSAMVLSPQFDFDPDAVLVFDHKYSFSDTDCGRIILTMASGPVQLVQFEGSSGGWIRTEIRLSHLNPETNNRLMFGIVTNSYGSGEGWWLDNVMMIFDYQCSTVPEIPGSIPQTYYLDGAYPNPFNTITVIPYGVPDPCHVLIEVYNILGQEVAVLTNTDRTPGNYKARWDASTAGSGIYFVRLQTSAFSKVKKIMLIK